MASGLIFVLGLFLLVMGQVPHLLIWLILLAVIFWLVNPVFTKLLGRWAVYDYTQAELGRANLLNAVNTVSTLITAVWVGHLIMMLLLPYWKIIGLLAEMDDKAFEVAEQYVQIFKPTKIIAITVFIISAGTSGTTSFMRHSLRKESINRKLKQ